MDDNEGWVTGEVLETVIALKAIRPGDWIKLNLKDVDLMGMHIGFHGAASQVEKVYWDNGSNGRASELSLRGVLGKSLFVSHWGGYAVPAYVIRGCHILAWRPARAKG